MNDAPPIPSQPEGCDCCGFETVNLKAYRLSPMTTKKPEGTHKWALWVMCGDECGCALRDLAVPHVPGCGWARERARQMQARPFTEAEWARGMPGTVLSEQAYLAGGAVLMPDRYPQQPEEVAPVSWWTRVRRWFR